ncbi:MAG: hypothetical protein HKN34_12560 [Gammaproteobacteria bacterium]|nr:hypothetical protein [Gammaproteobacteria bacterium]
MSSKSDSYLNYEIYGIKVTVTIIPVAHPIQVFVEPRLQLEHLVGNVLDGQRLGDIELAVKHVVIVDVDDVGLAQRQVVLNHVPLNGGVRLVLRLGAGRSFYLVRLVYRIYPHRIWGRLEWRLFKLVIAIGVRQSCRDSEIRRFGDSEIRRFPLSRFRDEIRKLNDAEG